MYAGGANFTSLLLMNVYRIYIFFVCLSSPLCWWSDKKGEKNLVSLICMHNFGIYAYMFCLVYVFHWISICYCYAWFKGELLWSLTLIHAYIAPWVLSSSKRGRLLAQRPITLVLMMINSCSYSLLIILCLNSFSDWPRY